MYRKRKMLSKKVGSIILAIATIVGSMSLPTSTVLADDLTDTEIIVAEEDIVIEEEGIVEDVVVVEDEASAVEVESNDATIIEAEDSLANAAEDIKIDGNDDISEDATAPTPSTELTLKNGDFEDELTNWTITGFDTALKVDSWSDNNKTNTLKLDNTSSDAVSCSAIYSVELEAGEYAFSFEIQGNSVSTGLAYEVTTEDGTQLCELSEVISTTGWDNWETYNTSNFTLTENTVVKFIISGDVPASYWGTLDNLKLYSDDGKVVVVMSELTLNNGDFESGLNNWTITGFDTALKVDSWSDNNKTNTLKLDNTSSDAVSCSAIYSVELEAGEYAFSFEIQGNSVSTGLAYEVTTEDGTQLCELSEVISTTGWDNWETYNTSNFTLTENTVVKFIISGDVPASYWGTFDNLKLYTDGGSIVINAVPAGITVPAIDNLPSDFIKGVDVSSVISLENSGVVFKDAEGNVKDIFSTMGEAGVNYIRVRVWNDPFDSEGNGYGGGNNDVDMAVAIAERIVAANVAHSDDENWQEMKLLVDFHYSDFWADPGKQKTPKAWASLDIDDKAAAVKSFTKASLDAIGATGVTIGMVQVGNETTQKICGESSWTNMAKIYNAGSEGVRGYSEDTLVAVHFTNPEKTSKIKELADNLNANGVDYDVFGTSYYPYWHGSLSNLTSVLDYVATTYDKKTMVAETSWANTLDDTDGHENTVRVGNNDTGDNNNWSFTLEGQANEVRDVMNAVNKVSDGKGIGVFYWEGAWITVGDTTGLTGDEYTAKVNDNKNKWETNGSGWASSFASEYDPDDAGLWYGGSAVDNQAFFGPDGRALESLQVFNYVNTGAVNKTTYIKDVATGLSGKIEVDGEIDIPTTTSVTYSIDGEVVSIDETINWNADDIAAIKVKRPGVYTVNGKVALSYDIESGEYAGLSEIDVTFTLTVEAHNLIDASISSFEADSSNYIITGGSISGDDPVDGTHAFHWYNASASTASIEYVIDEELPAGTYSFEVTAQGDKGSISVKVIDADTEDEIASSDSIEFEGWQVWKNPITSFTIDEPTNVKVGVYIDFNAEGWGSADCMKLYDPSDLGEAIAYNVAFNSNSGMGSMATIADVAYYDVFNLPKNTFAKSGYTFNGWNTKADGTGTSYTDEQEVESLTDENGATVTLYAQWKKVEETPTPTPTPEAPTPTPTPEAPTPTPADPTPTVAPAPTDEPTPTPTPVVKNYKYKITYKLNGGKNNTKNPAGYDQNNAVIKLKNPTKTGYTFKGWYTDKKLKNKITQIAKNSKKNYTLYAKWEANTYTVKFNANGGSGKVASKTLTYDKSYKLPANKFTKKGYKFAGWATSKADAKKQKVTYKNKSSIKNLTDKNKKTITLYAVWKKK